MLHGLRISAGSVLLRMRLRLDAPTEQYGNLLSQLYNLIKEFQKLDPDSPLAVCSIQDCDGSVTELILSLQAWDELSGEENPVHVCAVPVDNKVYQRTIYRTKKSRREAWETGKKPKL